MRPGKGVSWELCLKVLVWAAVQPEAQTIDLLQLIKIVSKLSLSSRALVSITLLKLSL